MFDRFFAPSVKSTSSPSFYDIIIDLKKRVEQLEADNADIKMKINSIQPVVYNITSTDQSNK